MQTTIQQSREELSQEINHEGRLEEFYMPNHPHNRGRFTGDNAYMYEFHKSRRLKLLEKYRSLYG
jgi:hypothetical protein